MLLSLSIKNFILFKDITINFNNNFTAITGESGSGKTLIVDALKFLVGQKTYRPIPVSDHEVIVKATFSVNEIQKKDICKINPLEIEDTISFERKYFQGKTSSYINLKSVILKLYKPIISLFIEIHGQFDSLIGKKIHTFILDRYANLDSKKEELKTYFLKINKIQSELNDLYLLEKKFQTKMEAVQEVFLELKKYKEIILNSEEIINKSKKQELRKEALNHLLSIKNIMEGEHSIDSLLQNISFHMNSITLEEDYVDEFKDSINKIMVDFSETSYRIESFLSNYEFDSDAHNYQDDDKATLLNLARKNRCSIEHLKNLLTEYSEIENTLLKNQNRIPLLERELSENDNLYSIKATKLSIERKKFAKKFIDDVKKELNKLDLSEMDFNIEIQTDIKQRKLLSFDQVFFLVKTAPNSAFNFISEVISGGEMSRFLLIIKSLFQKNLKLPTIIFDEIDKGTSGKTAYNIGSYLNNLSTDSQIIAVTHSAQVASRTKQHIHIKKIFTQKQVLSEISSLIGGKRVNEIAKMISGSKISQESINAATNLLKEVNE